MAMPVWNQRNQAQVAWVQGVQRNLRILSFLFNVLWFCSVLYLTQCLKRKERLHGPGSRHWRQKNMTKENQTSLDQWSYPKLTAKAEVGAHLQKGLDLTLTEMTFAVFYQGAHLLSTVAGKDSTSSRTAPTPGSRAQSTVNGQRVSDFSQVPANRKSKKDGSCQPVVNLRPLNNFLVKRRFKMEGIVLLNSLVQQGDWMVSIDLKDAYTCQLR